MITLVVVGAVAFVAGFLLCVLANHINRASAVTAAEEYVQRKATQQFGSGVAVTPSSANK